MKLIRDIKEITQPFDRAVVTLGNFDGVHIGHQALFHEVIEQADAIGGTSVAFTFDPHPLRILQGNGRPPLITLTAHKIELIARSGLDALIVAPFTEEFAAMPAEVFVHELLMNRVGMRALVVGPDYRFGRDRAGNVSVLAELSQKYHFDLKVFEWVSLNGVEPQRISSTQIRQLVMAGAVSEASRLLGRPYQIRGTVARGRDRGGRLLGIPTANIHLQEELCPLTGVYAVIVEWREQTYIGVANIGYSPTFEDHIFTIEVHILDFHESIYGETIRVNFVKRLRSEQKFNNLTELIDQIHRDIALARELITL